MQSKKHLLIFLILLFYTGNKIFATAQYGDILIIGKDTVWINSNPLEIYFERKGTRTIDSTKMYQNCTALWRGYVATWRLENKRLYLIRVQIDYCGDNPIDVNLTKEFGSNHVFAGWVSEIIVRPKGKLLQYVHMGYLSIYEEEVNYYFKDGILIDIKNQKYIVKEKNHIFPGLDFLGDTIRTIILKSIDSTTRATFSTDNSCNIVIGFNEKGEISCIELGYGCGFNRQPTNKMERIILEKSVTSLKGFPKLMKVTHKDYQPPTVTLYFSGHCLKFPYDRKYGCNYE